MSYPGREVKDVHTSFTTTSKKIELKGYKTSITPSNTLDAVFRGSSSRVVFGHHIRRSPATRADTLAEIVFEISSLRRLVRPYLYRSCLWDRDDWLCAICCRSGRDFRRRFCGGYQ